MRISMSGMALYARHEGGQSRSEAIEAITERRHAQRGGESSLCLVVWLCVSGLLVRSLLFRLYTVCHGFCQFLLVFVDGNYSEVESPKMPRRIFFVLSILHCIT